LLRGYFLTVLRRIVQKVELKPGVLYSCPEEFFTLPSIFNVLPVHENKFFR
jgi:hypothetical protein